MTPSVFGREYAAQYDDLYTDKDYRSECDFLDQVFRRYGSAPIRSILDLGCGTGNHAIPLAQRGYQVTGVDRSAEMLACATEKAAHIQLSEKCEAPAFARGDVRDVDLGRKFDAVIMMFAVLGYQLTNDDVLGALHNVRRHLNPGGLFVCDIWYGPAVLAIRPGDRVKMIPMPEGKLIRAASGTLDTFRHLCKVHYHLWRLSGERLLSESEETHMMRYFFPQELALFLGQAKLGLFDICPFGELDRAPDENTWNALLIAKPA